MSEADWRQAPGPPAGLSRRRFARLALAAAAFVFAAGHTPYRQWTVYRRRHLLILVSRSDPAAFELAERVVALLLEHLPSSSARVSRGPDLGRVASLIGTAQLDVALVSREDAALLREGRGSAAAHGSIPLRAIAMLGDHLLVCRDDFPDRHAYLLAEAIGEHWDELADGIRPGGPASVAAAGGVVPFHPGALAYHRGTAAPAGP